MRLPYLLPSLPSLLHTPPQVGLPSDRDQYVHRVGRTARAGKTGQSLLLLTDFEANFLNKLKELPIRNMPQLSPAIIEAEVPAMNKALSQVSWRSGKEEAEVRIVCACVRERGRGARHEQGAEPGEQEEEEEERMQCILEVERG